MALVGVQGELCDAATLTIGENLRGAERLGAIWEGLEAFVGSRLVCRAAIEGPSLGSTHREFDLGEASGVARAWVWIHYRIEPVVVPPLTLKKYANRATSKEEVIRYVVSRSRRDVDGDDAADAAVLAWIAHDLLTSRCPPSRGQAEVLQTLRAPSALKRKARRQGPNF